MTVTATLAPATTLPGVPGKVVGCDVVLVNHGGAAQACDLEVVGPAASWVLVWPSRLALPPLGEGRTRLAFSVPQAPPATVRFTVRVVGDAVVEARGSIEIAAVRDLRLVVRPMMARSRRTSQHTVTVENRGNVAEQADVAAVETGAVLAVELSAGSVSLAPGEEASLAMVVAARRWSLARATTTHRLCVGATVGGTTAAKAEAVFFQEPLRWRAPALAVVALLVVALFVWRSGAGGPGATTDLRTADRVVAAPPPTTAPALAPDCPAPIADGAPTVVIASFAFCPSPATVATGTEVVWRNDDIAAHDVTSVPPGSFDSSVLARGQSFRTLLEAPGAYQYACTLHPGMRGTIVVTG